MSPSSISTRQRIGRWLHGLPGWALVLVKVVLPAVVAVPVVAPLWTLVGDRTYGDGIVFGLTVVWVGDLVQVVFFEWRPWRHPPDDRNSLWER